MADSHDHCVNFQRNLVAGWLIAPVCRSVVNIIRKFGYLVILKKNSTNLEQRSNRKTDRGCSRVILRRTIQWIWRWVPVNTHRRPRAAVSVKNLRCILTCRGELVSWFSAGKFVQSHGGQAYASPGMDNYMSQGMDPSIHASARKTPANPQASMGYGQVHIFVV